MAFAYELVQRVSLGGGYWMTLGTFTNGVSDEGGDIDTGLVNVVSFDIQHTGSSVVANNPVVNETLTYDAPADGSSISIVTTANIDGLWMAVGVC